jgi:hypothetical protein
MCLVKKDTVIELNKPEVSSEDPLTEILRQGARKLLIRALEADRRGQIRRWYQTRKKGRLKNFRRLHLTKTQPLIAQSTFKHDAPAVDFSNLIAQTWHKSMEESPKWAQIGRAQEIKNGVLELGNWQELYGKRPLSLKLPLPNNLKPKIETTMVIKRRRQTLSK